MPGAGARVGKVVEAIVSAFDHPRDPIREVSGVGRRDELVVLDLQHVLLHSQAQRRRHERLSLIAIVVCTAAAAACAATDASAPNDRISDRHTSGDTGTTLPPA